MVSLDIQVVATALPVIRVHLHASLAALEWTMNAYTLTFAVLLLTGAALGERFGRRRMLAAGVAIFTAASAACALAPSAGALIAARAVQGAGAAVMLPLALSLLSAAFPPERRAWAIGIFSSVTGIAVGMGPVVGGAITQGLAWQWIFWLNIPIGVAMLPLILTRIPTSAAAAAGPGQSSAAAGGPGQSSAAAAGPGQSGTVSLDPVGLVLATGGVLGIVWALIRANGSGWGSAEIIGTLTAGVLLTALFIGWELRAASPMVPLRLFRTPAFAAGNVVAFAVFAMLLALVFFMAQYLQTGLGYGPLGTGVRLLPGWATLTVVAPIAGSLIGRVGERPLIAGGLAASAAGLAWIAAIARTGLPYWELVAPMVIAGCGVSFAIPAAASAVMGSVPPPMIGKASGTYNTLRQLGGVFGVAICAAVFAANGGYASPADFTDGFGPAMGGCAGLALAGAIAGLFVSPRATPTATAPAPRTLPMIMGQSGE
jgi:MFS family permease